MLLGRGSGRGGLVVPALAACARLAVAPRFRSVDGGKGGIDLIVALRMSNWGCRHIIDLMEPCYEYRHDYQSLPGVEGYDSQYWVHLYGAIKAEGTIWAPNPWSIRDERVRHTSVLSHAGLS